MRQRVRGARSARPCAAALALGLLASAPLQAAELPTSAFDFSVDSVGLTLRLEVGGMRESWADRLHAGFVLGVRENVEFSPMLPCQERCETTLPALYALDISPKEVADAIDRLRGHEPWEWTLERFGVRRESHRSR